MNTVYCLYADGAVTKQLRAISEKASQASKREDFQKKMLLLLVGSTTLYLLSKTLFFSKSRTQSV